jgi:hypothetical protein
MTIHSAADHGYRSEPIPPSVCIGDTFRLRCALGIYEARVLRPHRTPGYFETVVERWITEVPAFRQGFVGTLEIQSRGAILNAMRAE